MIETIETLTNQVIPGLDLQETAGEWHGRITFQWKDVTHITEFEPTEKDLENDIYPTECTCIFIGEHNYIIRMNYDKAIEKYTQSRK